jgi:predicted ArsR family transcriptional regulator
MTIDELAQAVGLTRTAVRGQVTVLMSRGLVEPVGARKGSSKPARLFALSREAEQRLSRAYVPVLVQLMVQLARRMTPAQLQDLIQEVGRGLGGQHRATGTLGERVVGANRLLHSLGGLTSVIEEGPRFVILGEGCPLSAATAEVPEACAIINSLLAEVIGQPVKTCCERYDRRRCCFEIARGAA